MAVPSPFLALKSELREHAVEMRRAYARALTADQRDQLEARLATLVLPHLDGAGIVAGYHPLKSEISPYPILGRLAGGQRAVLPWFADRESRMLFREAPAASPGPWGMLQPSDDAEVLRPDVLLIPLVYGDRFGTRIGLGAGHYDRALAQLQESGPIFTIGIAWEPQISDEPLPPDPWDIHLDAIATPAEWIDCRRNRAGERSPASDLSSS